MDEQDKARGELKPELAIKAPVAVSTRTPPEPVFAEGLPESLASRATRLSSPGTSESGRKSLR